MLLKESQSMERFRLQFFNFLLLPILDGIFFIAFHSSVRWALPALFDSQLSCSLREMQFLKCKWCCTFDRFVSEVLWIYTIDNYFRRTWITTSRAAAMPTYGSIWSLELEIEVALLAVCIPKNCNNPHAIAIALRKANRAKGANERWGIMKNIL